MEGVPHWFNHIMISPQGSRVMFLHRWKAGRWSNTRLFACNLDGGDLYLLNRGPMVSHCDWRDEEHILSWCEHGEKEAHYYLHTDQTQEVQIIGKELFSADGHCHYYPGPDRRWFVTDSYPSSPDHKRALMLFDTSTNTRYDIGRYFAPRELEGEIRCDLHPRWARSGKMITFDSAHEGPRGIYMVDVSGLVK